MPRVLVIDDDTALLRGLHVGLEALGHNVLTATTGAEGLAKAALEKPDVVVIDLGLPDVDGIELCRQLREWSSVPIVVLSADGREDRKVTAFDKGADDYVTKPFGIREFEARLRLAERHGAGVRVDDDSAALAVGGLELDVLHHGVRLWGQPVDLTTTEFSFLHYLARNAGRTCTYQLVLNQVWGLRSTEAASYLHVYAYRLRKKLNDEGGKLIVTVPRIGYRLEAPA